MNGASYVVRSLAAEGVEHVFMVPGGMNDPFMPAMTETTGVCPVVAAHRRAATTRQLQRVFVDALHGRDPRYLDWIDVVEVASKAGADIAARVPGGEPGR